LGFELRVALRYLTAGRKQAFVSLISGISVLGVAVGVMALMIALAVMTGLQGEIRTRILGATSHLSLFKSFESSFTDYREVTARIREIPRVEGAAPALYTKALLTSPVGSAVATIKGILPDEERTVTELENQLQQGSLEDLIPGSDGLLPVLLGRDMASSLAVGVGDVITLTSPQPRLSPMGVLPRMKKLRVVGLVHTGLFEFDAGWAYLHLHSAQQLEGREDTAGLIEVRVDDMYAVEQIGDSVLEALGRGYTLTTWIEMNHSLFSALWLEKVAITITIGLIVMVAALNIVATLILMVMEKHKDIAILVAMGASRGAITRIFMLQGTVIGAVGTALGASVGWTTCTVLDRYRLIPIPQDVYQISHLRFVIEPFDAGLVIAGALLICFLATLPPARGAARLDPAIALRYE
jgi:lipoprotein-releasing system permease protein